MRIKRAGIAIATQFDAWITAVIAKVVFSYSRFGGKCVTTVLTGALFVGGDPARVPAFGLGPIALVCPHAVRAAVVIH